MEAQRHILVLTSSTGGGHDMRARSIEHWAAHPSCADLKLRVSRFQTLESISKLYRLGVETYNWIQLHAPWLHHLYFNFLERAAMHRKASTINAEAAKRFRAQLEAMQPDLLVSTHAHLNHGFFELARQWRPNLPCVTYCGEVFGGYGFSRHWVSPRSDGFFAATAECRQQALDLGMPPERAHQAGFMLNPAFWEEAPPPDTTEAWVRDFLRLDPARGIVVLATGANSAHNHHCLLNALAKASLPVQAVALCGNNELAREQLNRWAAKHPQVPLRPLPRIDSPTMRQLLAAADAVVARPGTGTTSEAVLCGCPIIHNGLGGIMPQEWITVKWLRKHGQDRVMSRPRDLPCLLQPLIENRPRQTARAAFAALRPEGHPRLILEQFARLMG